MKRILAAFAVTEAIVIGGLGLGGSPASAADDWCPNCMMAPPTPTPTPTDPTPIDKPRRGGGGGGGESSAMGDDWCPSGC